MKIRNLPLPSLATNPVWGLNAAMQHKQDRTFFVWNPLKKQMGSIFKHPCLWQGGMPQWTLLLKRSFKLWPFKYHSQPKNSAPQRKELCDRFPHRLSLRFSVCGFSPVMSKWQRERFQYVIDQVS